MCAAIVPGRAGAKGTACWPALGSGTHRLDKRVIVRPLAPAQTPALTLCLPGGALSSTVWPRAQCLRQGALHHPLGRVGAGPPVVALLGP